MGHRGFSSDFGTQGMIPVHSKHEIACFKEVLVFIETERHCLFYRQTKYWGEEISISVGIIRGSKEAQREDFLSELGDDGC